MHEEASAKNGAGHQPRTALARLRDMCAAFFLCIFLAVLFVAPHVDFSMKRTSMLDKQPLLFLASIALIAIALLVARAVAKSPLRHKLCRKKTFLATTLAASALLLVMQALMVKSAWFYAGWDVSFIAETRPGISDESLASYLSQNTNQLFIHGLFSLVRGCLTPLGENAQYLGLIAGSCLCVCLSILLVCASACKIFGYRVGYLSYAVSFCFIGLSPWIMVPYTDTYGMLCPSACLLFYACIKNPRTRWAGILFFSVLGYFVKPTSIFIFLAIVCIELVCAMGKFLALHRKTPRETDTRPRGRTLLKGASIIATSCLSVALAFALVLSVQTNNPPVDDNSRFTATHYLMMGANTKSTGGYRASDVEMSKAEPTVEARQEMNIETWKQRLESMGVAKTIKLALRKTLMNFSDGSMNWEKQAGFCLDKKNRGIQGECPALISFFGITTERTDFESGGIFFRTMAQVVWLALLAGAGLGFLRRNCTRAQLTMYFALAMLTCFLMIFEARPRYLILYLPYFAVCGVAGWCALGQTLSLAAASWARRR